MQENQMQVTYEKTPDCPCFHVDMQIPYEEDYQMKMLKNNRIRGAAAVSGCGKDGGSRYTYQTEGWISLQKKFESKDMNREEILSLARQLIRFADDIRDYMLLPDRILLAPEYIFEKEGEYRFCYLPVSTGSFGAGFHGLTEFFVKSLDYRDTDGIFLAYFLHKETLRETYDLKGILEDFLEGERKRKEAEKAEKAEEAEEAEETGKKQVSGKRRKGLEKGIKKDMGKNQEEESEEEVEEELEESEEESDEMEEELSGKKYQINRDAMPVKEEYARYTPLKRVIGRFRTGRWGDWDDLITESTEWP